MKFPASVERLEELASLRGELHLAIGVFDGVHLGHKAVIESAVFSAKRSGGISGVLTFDPHPSRLFRPEDPTLLMMDVESKTAMLHDVGVDVVIRKHFDWDFAGVPAEAFLAQLKAALPSLNSIYVGANFRFGKMRAGTVKTLIESGQDLGLGVFSVDRLQHNGEPISSTRIRQELQAGAIEAANALLGFNYYSKGVIVGGGKIGRKLGFPTLNLPWHPECSPRFGVYSVRFRSPGETGWQAAVANYGVKPTVAAEGQTPTLEVHALKGSELTEDAVIEVEWLRFIRAEKKFDSIDELKAQITADCETARSFVENG